MPFDAWLTDSGKNVSKQCVDHCYIYNPSQILEHLTVW